MTRKRNQLKYLSAGLFLPLAGFAQHTNQPNIICLVCEDISPYIGCYGDEVAVTPNIDRLATEGVRYSNFYTTMGVSSPSRAGLITGMYPSAIGANYMRTMNQQQYLPEGIVSYEVIPPTGVKCYTEYLREAGYYCTNNSKTDFQFTSPLTTWDENGGDAHWKNTPEGKPFFSIFNFMVTHESQVWARANQPVTVDVKDIVIPPYFPDNEVVRRDMAVMYSNIEVMDQQVQEVIDELAKAGLLENTIIVWYSDNGGPLPRQKRSVYNSGLQVPLIIRYPDQKDRGTVDEQMCSFVDIPATMLSLVGIRPPEYMHGKAFAGKYEAPHRQYIYGAKDRCDEMVDKIGTVRDKKYQYIRNYMPEISGYRDLIFRKSMPMMQNMLELRDKVELNEVQMAWFKVPRPMEEFYDVENDPHNINNLIDDPGFREDIDRLRGVYEQWIHDYNSLWMLSEKEMMQMFMPEGKQQVVEKPVIIQQDNRVQIFCPTEGSSIAYQVNGKGYNEKHWLLYTGPVKLKSGDKIEAIATRAGYKQSEPVSTQF
jgi:arylsulfatase A-like enzyme